MAAPKGNQYAKGLTNSGRPRAFATPKELLETAIEYFNYCDANPEYKYELARKPYWVKDPDDLVDGGHWEHLVKVPVKNPYLISGFCLFAGVNTVWLNQFENALDLKDPTDQEFSKVIHVIRDHINRYHLSGGLNGTLDSRLAGRMHVAERKEVDSTTTAKVTFDTIDYDLLDDETLEKLAKAKKK